MIILRLIFSIYLTLVFWLMNILYIVLLFIPFLIIHNLNDAWGQAMARGWGQAVIRSMFLPVKIIGQENIPEGSVVLASNHTSMLDIHLTLGYFPKKFHFLMKEELFKIPLFGTAVAMLGYFPINRTNPKRAMETMRAVAKKIQGGESVLIYPEGTRNKHSTEMLPFKSGMARIAIEAQRPLLPIVVVGCRQVCPSSKKLMHWHPLTIKIGKPLVPPINDSKLELDSFSNEVRKVMDALLQN